MGTIIGSAFLIGFSFWIEDVIPTEEDALEELNEELAKIDVCQGDEQCKKTHEKIIKNLSDVLETARAAQSAVWSVRGIGIILIVFTIIPFIFSRNK